LFPQLPHLLHEPHLFPQLLHLLQLPHLLPQLEPHLFPQVLQPQLGALWQVLQVLHLLWPQPQAGAL